MSAIVRACSEIVQTPDAPAMPSVPADANTIIMSKSGANTIGRRADTLAQVVSSASSATAFNLGFAWLVNNIGVTALKGMRIEPDTYTINNTGSNRGINLGTNIIVGGQNTGPISNLFMYGNLAQPKESIILRCGTSNIAVLAKGTGSLPSRDLRLLNFTLDGATISAQVIFLTDVDGVLIQNVIFERSNNANAYFTGFGSGPCVYLEGQNYTIESCISRDHTGGGDALAVGGTNIFVYRCDLSGTVAQNGSITTGGIIHGEIAYNNVHDKWTYGGTSIENQSRRTENLHIHHNTYTNLNNQGISFPNPNPNPATRPVGSYGDTVTQAAGRAIMFISSGDGGPNPFDHKGIEIDHNRIENNFGVAIKMGVSDTTSAPDRLASFVHIHDNTIINNGTTSGHHAIYVGPAKTIIIENNQIDNASGYAIRFRSPEDGIVTDDIQILNNTVTDVGAGTYYTVGCTDVTLADNSPP